MCLSGRIYRNLCFPFEGVETLATNTFQESFSERERVVSPSRRRRRENATAAVVIVRVQLPPLPLEFSHCSFL